MNEEIKTLHRLFKALHEAKDVLGEDNWREIRERLSSGALKSEMFDTAIADARNYILKRDLSYNELISRLNPPIPFTPKKTRFPIKWFNWKRVKKIFR